MTTPAKQTPVKLDVQKVNTFIDYMLELVLDDYELETQQELIKNPPSRGNTEQ